MLREWGARVEEATDLDGTEKALEEGRGQERFGDDRDIGGKMETELDLVDQQSQKHQDTSLRLQLLLEERHHPFRRHVELCPERGHQLFKGQSPCVDAAHDQR